MKTRRVNPATLTLHLNEYEAWAIHNDESGWQICGGFSPINAECRDVDNHTLTVDALSGQLAGDILDEPCTTAGIFCRDSDQSKPRKCANYAIRFMCSSIPDSYAPQNICVIGIVARLSVFVPIACVAIFHISRVCRRRRRSATEVLVSGTSSSGSCDQADLPPSYSFLFGDTVRSISAIEFPSQNSDTGQSNASFNALPAGPAAPEPGPRRQSEAGRPRFPNMHISIYEIFSRPESRESRDVTRPQTPDLSYARTPPPDYQDAVVILGSEEININYILDAKEREELH
ncbi:hypothetical protein DPMN_144426 [Dreissena polymorpha]|uniref:WxxW domain-containing protein n=1 Tax=Dreissena polymorpha TaxID=45954 RepID=A0A9D4GEZ3_DREPO|nr:hypothetical protein DPMN_144426 [Dreissena polymorpha]